MESTTQTISKRAQQVVNLDMEELSISKTCSAPEPLTPPATPLKGEDQSDTGIKISEQEATAAPADSNDDDILSFHGKLELGEELGRGSWSKVFEAHQKPIRSQPFFTDSPPSPPASPAEVSLATPCYAVKRPLHSMAVAVIKNEARILSKLTRSSLASSHIVGFYGYDMSNNSLVLSRVPETLGMFSARALRAEKDGLRHELASNPIIGLRPWLSISLQLMIGLAWIHSQGVIHGDIKASNVLLSPSPAISIELSADSSPKAVFCDFSSSQLISRDSSQSTAALPTDAITTSYASPELLKAYSRSFSAGATSEPALPTQASDIWALAVTLIVAATGEDPYAQVGNEMRKLAMAKEGMVLEAARMDDRPMRTMRGSVVEKAVRSPLKKKVEARIGITSWIEEFEALMNKCSDKSP